jgi:nitroimidazol reductase NimA-like FMN-containing flavoprotein (pyridoxamine 5'-phosphate oxidase superfamily)
VGRDDWRVGSGFALDEFLARPLVARVATAGPKLRPVWFLWEDDCFWWLTGAWARLADELKENAQVELVVDTCDLATGEVLQVRASGHAELVPFDADRALRKLTRYLGPDRDTWDARFDAGTFDDPSVRFARLAPERLTARDLSFAVSRRR